MKSLLISAGASVVVLLVAVGLLATQGQGQALPMTLARPSVVRTINLTALFDSLDERAAKDAELTTLAQQLEARRKASAQHVKDLEADVEAFPKGSANYEQAMRQLSRATLDYQAEAEWALRQFDTKKATIYRSIYLSIRQAAGLLAAQQGYDIVQVDDSKEPLPEGNEQEIKRQISARRMLHASEEVDITSELAEFMNRLFRQS